MMKLMLVLVVLGTACSKPGTGTVGGDGRGGTAAAVPTGDAAPVPAPALACEAVQKLGREARVADAGKPYPCDEIGFVWTGSEHVILYDNKTEPTSWGGKHSLLLARLRRDGSPVGTPVTVTDEGICPSLAWSGSDLAASWRIQPKREDFGKAPARIVFSRIDISGSLIGGSPPTVVPDGIFGTVAPAPLVATPDGFALVGVAGPESRQHEKAAFFASISKRGTASGPPSSLIDADVGLAGLVRAENGFGVAWAEQVGTGDDAPYKIRFTRLGGDGRKLGEGALVGDYAVEAALAWTGAEYALVRAEEISDSDEGEISRLLFSRFDRQGQRIGSDVGVGEAEGPLVSEPAVVWTGNEYGVAWVDDRNGNEEIYFARLGPNGAGRGPALRATVDACVSSSPALAWDGSAFSLVWRDCLNESEMGIYFVRIGCP